MSGTAVVIINFRTPQLARRCAAAAGEAAAVGQVLVIDSASGDGSAGELRAAGLQVQEQDRNAGFAAAVNAGFRATSAPIVIVLNADAEPDPGALDRLVEHLDRNPRVGVAAPQLRFPGGEAAAKRLPSVSRPRHDVRRALRAARIRACSRAPAGSRPRAGRSPLACARDGRRARVRRSAYDDAGPFDERFFLYLEETEWQRRVRGRGWEIERVPGAGVVHHVRAGSDGGVPAQFVVSARRYLVADGHSPRATTAVLNSAILCSRLGLRALAVLHPAKRDVLRRRASRIRPPAGHAARR